MIDRNHEYTVYEQLKGKEITDPGDLYVPPENGYKITEYIENTRNM